MYKEEEINRLINNRLNEIERLYYFIKLNDLYSLEQKPKKRIIPKPIFNYTGLDMFKVTKKEYEQKLKNWEKEKNIEEIKWMVSLKIWNKTQNKCIEARVLYLDHIHKNRIEILELEEIKNSTLYIK
jgi:hypothetical protein